jgi:hypothetical protein
MKKISLERSTSAAAAAACAFTIGLTASLPAAASPATAVVGPEIGADLRVPVLPQLLNFGNLVEFTTYTKAVTVVNTTSESVTITGVSVSFDNCFCFSAETRPLPVVLEPHGRLIVAVHWAAIAGRDVGALTVQHSLGVSTSVVTGNGIPF